MQDFTFRRPASLADAVEALRSIPGGKLLAGGQSLIPVMKLDLAAPATLVPVAGLGELRGIRLEGSELVIGAGMTHREVGESAEVAGAIPALAALAGAIGDPQVRNRGTLGGSVAHNDPAADYPAALLALDATVVTDRREVSAADFLGSMFETALADDEVITAVRFRVPETAAYAKFPNPASKYAIVGVMVARSPGGVRVAVTGAAPGAFRHEGMERALAADFSASSLDGVPVDAEELLSDPQASAEYRAHLVGVMARRAVEACG
ncbi:MAG: xanthine dehydrogenase family protein subunit M [Gammaproteobacteria bacterium]|nr:xanthine dehydrogenase family protein subunit M [Gammaproteobacteria bacterium]